MINSIKMKLRLIFLGIVFLLFGGMEIKAQFVVNGDFRTRFYYDTFSGGIQDRQDLSYVRYLGRINIRSNVGNNVTFYSELMTFTDNPLSVTRNIAGTEEMYYGISQLFAEAVFPNVPVFDQFRMRVGRQQFPIGRGLSQGSSTSYVRLFDAVRFDMTKYDVNLSLFGSVTRQNLSPSGLFPDSGGDRLYIARLSRTVLNQDLMSYFIMNQLDGKFNDSYIIGAGIRGNILSDELEYFGEYAHQTFNTVPGMPKMGGHGYMAGIGYRWPMGPFRWVKIETRYAAYQGNDESTDRIERFSPLYPSFFWGDRAGFVNGVVGGNFPFEGDNLEGSRIWYNRIYFVPNALPRLRVQFQYIYVTEYIDNDNYNSYNNEFSARLYYAITRNSRIQFRYVLREPNEKDFNPNLPESSTRDRFSIHRYMFEWHIRF